MSKSVVVVCNDVVGFKMAGPAIRCVEVATVLSGYFDVLLVAPAVDKSFSLPFDVCLFSDGTFLERASSADVIIIQGDALRVHPFLKNVAGAIIADLYCPVLLEYHQASDGLAQDVRGTTSNYLSEVLHEQLVYADHFLCASDKQRDFWLGALMLAGRVNAYRWPKANYAGISELLSLLPFGLSASKPVQEKKRLREKFNIPDDEFVLIWGGGLYQWFDPVTIIRAVNVIVSSGHKIHLVFVGVKHPNPGITEHDMCATAVQLATELGLIGRFVHFNFGWVDYADRHNFLLDANVGVSAHFDNPETKFSFRTRMLDYLWCGLPIVASKGDVFGDALDTEGVGIAVDFEDVDGWVAALTRMSTDSEFLESCKYNSSEYAKGFHWPNVVKPLIDICNEIKPSADRDYVRASYAMRFVAPIVLKLGMMARLKGIYTAGGFYAIFQAILRRVKRIRAV